MEGRLNAILEKQPVRPGEGVRLVAHQSDLGKARDRARTSSPGVLRLGVESTAADPGPPPDAWKAIQILRDAEETKVEVGLNHLMFAAQAGGQGFSFGHGVQLRARVQLRPRSRTR